ncbi:MAG: hypothetical protein KGI28_01480 [Thaumarchaeota archaeon]|nr:hypothetical protein [Nitrososphaerota archaeon]
MSKTPESKEFQSTKDFFALCNNSAERLFAEVEKTVPQYHQAITSLQHAYTNAWKNATESAISMQREFASKVGANTAVPPTIAKMVNDATEEMIKAQTVQNKAVIASIDAAQQSVNTFYESTKSFTGLTQTAMQNWISSCTPSRN